MKLNKWIVVSSFALCMSAWAQEEKKEPVKETPKKEEAKKEEAPTSILDLVGVDKEKLSSESDIQINLQLAPVSHWFAQGDVSTKSKGLLSDAPHFLTLQGAYGRDYLNIGYRENLFRSGKGLAGLLSNKLAEIPEFKDKGFTVNTQSVTGLETGFDQYLIQRKLDPESNEITQGKRNTFGAAYDKGIQIGVSSGDADDKKCLVYNAAVGGGIGGAAVTGLADDASKIQNALFVGATINYEANLNATAVVKNIQSESSIINSAATGLASVIDEIQFGLSARGRNKLLQLAKKSDQDSQELLPTNFKIYMRFNKKLGKYNVSYELSQETLNRTFGETSESTFHKLKASRGNWTLGAFRNNSLDLWGGSLNMRLASGLGKKK